MDYYRNILITGCSSGLGQALFNRVWEDDTLTPFAHYRSEHGDPHALIGDITDSDFPEKLDNHIRKYKIGVIFSFISVSLIVSFIVFTSPLL